MNHREQFDNILDEALSEYREAEPLAGLEDRVMQRLRRQPEERRIAWWKWGAVAACAVMLAVAAWLGWRGHSAQIEVARRPVEASKTVASLETKTATQISHTAPGTGVPHSHIGLQAKSERGAGDGSQAAETGHQPALAVSDSGHEYPRRPTPLTGQERQLIALALTHPDALRAISQEDQPISIAPLTIQPLPSEANQNGDN